MKKIFLIALVALPLLVISKTNVWAANGITVNPAFQDITLSEDSATQSAVITVSNSSNNPINLEVLPTSVDQHDLSGRLSLELFSGAANESFSYLTFSNDRFVLEPGQSQDIKVNIAARTDLKPGGNYVGVVFRSVLDEPSNKQVVLPAVASFLLITKEGGAVYNLSLTKVAGLASTISFRVPKTIALTFNNAGNVHLQPRGSISIEGLNHRLIAQSTVNESSQFILPGRTRLIQQNIRTNAAPLPIDFLTTTINGTSGEERTPYSYQTSVVYFSPWLLVALLLIITGVILLRIKKHEA